MLSQGVSQQQSKQSSLPEFPRLRGLFRIGAPDRLPACAVVLALFLAHGVVLPARYGFLDDYTLLYGAKSDPSSVTDHILGGGRPLFALGYRLVFPLVDDIAGLRLIRALTLVLTCVVALVVVKLLRSVGTSPWTAASTGALLFVLPSTQVSVAWATMFIVPVAMLLGLCASVALQREVLISGRLRPRGLALPAVLLSLAVISYQPGAMAFWLGLAVLVFGQDAVRQDLSVLRRLWVANVAVFSVALVLGFVVLKLGVAYEGVSGARAGTVTDVAGKIGWFFTEALPRPLDPWSLTPRLEVVAAVTALLVVGLGVLRARSAALRVLTFVMAGALTVLSYVPNLLVAENWASTRTMVALMPMVALLTTFAARSVLRSVSLALPIMFVRLIEPALLGLAALAFTGHASQQLQAYFVEPQQAELAAAEQAVDRQPASGELVVLRSDWFDTVAPFPYYDEFGIPSSCQEDPAVGMTQLLYEEKTGGFRAVRFVERADATSRPQVSAVLDYADVLNGIVTTGPSFK